MIELAFNESAAGALKQARRTMEGSGDVLPLSLYLDIGDISDMDGGIAGRKKLLDTLFGEYRDAACDIFSAAQDAYIRLMEAKAAAEPVRMWICKGNPAEQCGLYFVCHVMAGSSAPLSVVRVPEEVETGESIVSYRHTGELHPEVLNQYIKYQEPLSRLQRTVYANAWTSLVRENAPLRAVVNGSLMGVPVDFYDFALRANMPDREFRIAYLIGSTLGNTPGIGDQWLYLRVNAMIQSNELVVVSAAAGHHYSAVVRRGK